MRAKTFHLLHCYVKWMNFFIFYKQDSLYHRCIIYCVYNSANRNLVCKCSMLYSFALVNHPALWVNELKQWSVESVCYCREGVSYTLWTRWEVKGDVNMTLLQFLDAVKASGSISFLHFYTFHSFFVVMFHSFIYFLDEIRCSSNHGCVWCQDDICSINAWT